METKKLIIVCIAVIICLSIVCVGYYITNHDVKDINNSSNITDNQTNSNDTNDTLSTNNTTNSSTKNDKSTTSKKSSSSSSSQKSKSSSSSSDWEYGTGAGSYNDPDITWKHNKKTGYSEYHNKKTGKTWGGYNIA